MEDNVQRTDVEGEKRWAGGEILLSFSGTGWITPR